MSTTQHPTPLLPENVQEAVNLAYSRMTAMKEQEDVARRSKTALEVEIGRLALEKDTADGLAKEAVAAFSRAKTDLDIKNGELSTVITELDQKKQELAEVKNALASSKELTERELTRRNEVIADCKKRTDEVVSRETAFEAEKVAFEARKKALVEAIQSI